MRRLSTALLAIFIALVFLTYMVTYTVRYDEVAVLTTFEQPTEPDPAAIERGENSGSVIQEPGLYFKWPWPVQRVEKYPTRLQLLQDVPEQIRLADGNTIIVNMSVTWRVEDPLEFFIAHGSVEEANKKLRPQMSDLRSVIQQYEFDAFVNRDPDKVKLAEMEEKVAEQFREQLAGIQPSYGIEIVQVSMGKLLYAQSTAEQVNTRMSTTQQGLARTIREEGNNEAQTITNQASNIQNQIVAFADDIAATIRAVGERESAAISGRYGEYEDFAIFLRSLEAAEATLENKSKFILDARDVPPFNVFIYGPGEAEDLSRLKPATQIPLRPDVDEQGTETGNAAASEGGQE